MNYQLAQDSGHLLHFNTTGCLIPAGMTVPLNEWTHIAVTAGGGIIRVYVDGKQVAQSACNLGTDSAAPVVIGGSGGCPQKFPGFIDEVRIWNTAKTADQISASYNCTVDASSAGLIAYWDFNEQIDSQLILDASPSGFDGTLGATSEPGDDDPVRVASDVPLTCDLFSDGFESEAEAISGAVMR